MMDFPCSNDHNQEGHGIESPDMAWEENCLTNSTACNGTCIEKLVRLTYGKASF
jgi:hypothetical protein